MTIAIDGNSLCIDEVERVARGGEKVVLTDDCLEHIRESRSRVEGLLEKDSNIYGINTGFGELANIRVDDDKLDELQKNLILSHACGVGEPLDKEIVRATILLRANTLAKGYSGVRPIVVETLIDMLNNNVHPVIPCKGSVGASGDLAPLAHLSMVLIGGSKAEYEGEIIDGKLAMERADIEPIRLKSKEGLALLNGTPVMTAIGALAIHDARQVLKAAQIASAMSLEALKGTSKAFDERIHKVRPHPGQSACARNLRNLINNSEIIASHTECDKVQDPYTLRCMPQVYGAARDTLDYIERVILIEMNSATDNPLIFSEGDVLSGGNFHGQPVAFVMDFLGIALAEVGNISERTTDKLMYEVESGLPPFLTTDPGLNSGFMISQYTAASLVSENKVLAHPASIDSIPTSAGQEDHVSMGTIAARHARDIIRNVQYVVAIETLAAAQGIEYRDLEPGDGVKAAHQAIRKYVPPLEGDRSLSDDIELMKDIIASGELVSVVEEQIGEML